MFNKINAEIIVDIMEIDRLGPWASFLSGRRRRRNLEVARGCAEQRTKLNCLVLPSSDLKVEDPKGCDVDVGHSKG